MSELHHYVPQFLLRYHVDAAGLLHVYDKAEARTFRTGPRNVAAERDFYSVEIEGSAATLEPSLAALEGAASAIIGRILERGEIGFLSPEDRGHLARFAAVQFMRGRGQRERLKDMSAQLLTRLEAVGPLTDELRAQVQPLDDDAAKLQAMLHLVRAPEHFAIHFLDKAWLLMETPGTSPFWVGDSPVTLHNDKPTDPWRSNLGLAVKGIQIYLPLSPTFALAFYCGSIAEEVLAGYGRALRIKHELGAALPFADGVGYLADGLRYGYAVPAAPPNVEFFNSLQVAMAERWVFSSAGDFALAHDMIQRNPELKVGPRLEVQ